MNDSSLENIHDSFSIASSMNWKYSWNFFLISLRLKSYKAHWWRKFEEAIKIDSDMLQLSVIKINFIFILWRNPFFFAHLCIQAQGNLTELSQILKILFLDILSNFEAIFIIGIDWDCVRGNKKFLLAINVPLSNNFNYFIMLMNSVAGIFMFFCSFCVLL